jgi:excisionase family DNA binding protein
MLCLFVRLLEEVTMSTDTSPKTLTIEEAAKVLRISRASAYEAARRGELPTVRIGKRLLVPQAALDRLLSGGAAA